MSLQLDVRRGVQTPRVSNYPPYATSAGDDAIDLAASAGLILDPWQQYVLRHGLGERPDGRWSAFKVATWVPRQSGKGAIIEARVLAGLFLFGERLLMWSAHEYKTAQEGFLRLRELIERTPDLARRIKSIREANGEQGIELIGGQRLRFVARSRGSGRGFSGDLNVLDEAQYLTAEQMAALLPTMSARPNPQLWFFGTPPEVPDAWVYGLREDGEAGAPRLAYFDWGLDLDLDDPAVRAQLGNRDLWYAANPALGIRITEEFVEGEHRPSGLGDKFAYERLGVWLPRATGGSNIITDDLWRELADPGADRPTDVAFAVDINPARTHAAITYAGVRPDGRHQVGLVDYRRGTAWVVPRLVELREKWNPLAIGLDPSSPAGSLLLDLERAGITQPEDPEDPQRGDLAVPDARAAAAAYGLFVDAARQKQLVHLDEAPLNVALSGAQTRTLAGGSAWDRKGSTDICPLVAATLAHWALEIRGDLDEDRDPIGVW